jgi:hypothetical protein
MIFLRLNHMELGERKFVKENRFYNNACIGVNKHVDVGV